jgi:hypothetical protein
VNRNITLYFAKKKEYCSLTSIIQRQNRHLSFKKEHDSLSVTREQPFHCVSRPVESQQVMLNLDALYTL